MFVCNRVNELLPALFISSGCHTNGKVIVVAHDAAFISDALIGTRRLRKWARQDLSEEIVLRLLGPRVVRYSTVGVNHQKAGNRCYKRNKAIG